ncbi:MAG: hypothetical protein GY801_44770 [bacterium]|nr:hypothetical protein [bacterium]
MKILGIHDGHTATACVVEDGKILAMVSEERFTRVKNDGGIPRNAIDWVLKSTQTTADDIDSVAIVGLMEPITDIGRYTRSRHKYFSLLAEHLPQSFLDNPKLYQPYIRYQQKKRREFVELRDVLGQHGISAEKIRQVEHHEAHAATAYYLSCHRNENEPVLTITLDGSGDGLCGTVSIGEDGRLKRIKSIPTYHSPGIMYSRVTQHLGMKPLEHEYKVMGLAPYAPDIVSEKAYKIFQRYLSLSPDGLSFQNNTGAWGNSFLHLLHKDLAQLRFDGVAAGLQRRFEELCVRFVSNWIEETGIHNVALSGGLFMNVKLNMLLANLEKVEKLFIMPSGGDESTALGAALIVYVDRCKNHPSAPAIQALKDVYLGPEFSEEEIEQALRTYHAQVRYTKVADIEEESAKLLVQGKIIGRMSGRMEWGARALGNRSILANPSSSEIVRKINSAIKMRDFWMPFAASLLWERKEKYLLCDAETTAPYMITAFRTQEAAHKDLIAGLHPFDLTCRPQLVQREWNPKYYNLLKQFEAMSGIGGLLNTSFNIHGYPVVCSPRDAIETLLHSGLDCVTLENYLVERI